MSNASDDTMYVWITIKTLSHGIRRAVIHNYSFDVITPFDVLCANKRAIRVRLPGEPHRFTVYSDEWWPTWEEAYAHAEELRKKEIARLRRRVEKLESIKFIRKD